MRRQLSKGETFKVDYITYVLIVAALLCLCAYSLWTLRREENLERSPRRVPGKQAGADRDSSTDGLAQAEIVQQRELHNVPAPWGWPGNVRELRNVIERGMILARQGWIETVHLPPFIRGGEAGKRAGLVLPEGVTVAEAEKMLILQESKIYSIEVDEE